MCVTQDPVTLDFPLAMTAPDAVRVEPGLFADRYALNTRYLLSLPDDGLLQAHYLEAGILNNRIHSEEDLEGMFLGWEAPNCHLRGHFVGHWLSAASQVAAATGNVELRLKAERIIAGIRRCQVQNGGEWAGSIPTKYLQWISGELPKQHIWAPHYTIHKTLMGLIDAVRYLDNEEALTILDGWASWFYRWSGQFDRSQMDDILDVETGGMLEAWADLYGFTGKKEHLALVYRYDRPRLFDRLLAGQDPLTNIHANTTIPEVQGAARAYEVTGDERWRQVVEAYWKCAVTDRGTFCTGSQTTGEVWTPPYEHARRLGSRTQEHCVAYNMIRLAHYLLQWTGDAAYGDYIERSLYNGVLAQQHPHTGQITYFLPLEAGGRKVWGSPMRDFWCCHGSLVQSHAHYTEWAWLSACDGLTLSQYIPSTVEWQGCEGKPVRVTLAERPVRGSSYDNANPAYETRRPTYRWHEFRVSAAEPTRMALRFRLPDWLKGPARVTLNGEPIGVEGEPGSFAVIEREWSGDVVQVALPSGLSLFPIPDEPGTVAFLDGPLVLAGMCDEERTLVGDVADLEAWIKPDNEREWGYWIHHWRVTGQERGLRLKPLHEVVDEPYTVYFPVRKPAAG